MLAGQMKRNKIKSKWIWTVIFFALTVFFLFPVKITMIYAAEGERECTIAIPVSVEIKGDAENISSEIFEYGLKAAGEDSQAEEIFDKIEVTKTGITRGQFKEMHYVKPGDYKYTVYQLKGNNKELIYDDSIYEVTVRVVNNQNGGLTAEVWAVKNQSDQKVDEIKFVNSYKKAATATTESKNNTIYHTTNTITKSSIGTSSPKTGDKSNLILWSGVAVLSGLCIFFFILIGKRRKL